MNRNATIIGITLVLVLAWFIWRMWKDGPKFNVNPTMMDPGRPDASFEATAKANNFHFVPTNPEGKPEREFSRTVFAFSQNGTESTINRLAG